MIIDYKGYVAEVDLDEDGVFHGRVVNTRDVINFYGKTAPELQREMKKSVEEYLAFCRDRGREPERPYSGEFVVRVPPELHRAIAMTAARNNLSLNKFVAERLARDPEIVESEQVFTELARPPQPKRSPRGRKREGATR